MLREVEEIGGPRVTILRPGPGSVEDDGGGDILSHVDRHIERIRVAEREADEGELVTGSGLAPVLAQELHGSANVTAPLFHLFIERPAQLLRLLDRRRCLAMVEVRGERHEARLRQPVAGQPDWLRQPPPLMQNDNPWPRSAIWRR